MSNVRTTLAALPTTKVPAHGVSFGEAGWVWLRVALLSFGGPAGQIAVMHRILVDEKRWISEGRFLHALNYCMLLPGPEAQQLATYIAGCCTGRAAGCLPAHSSSCRVAIAIMALSYVYAVFGDVGLVQSLFFGLKAAVLAIVLQAVVRIGRRALRTGLMKALAGIAFAAIFFFQVPFPLIVLAAALVGFAGERAGAAAFGGGGASHGSDGDDGLVDDLLGRGIPDHAEPTLSRSLGVMAIWLPLWLGPVVALAVLLGTQNVFTQIAVFFSTMAVVTFGGAYAMLAYVAQEAVQHYHWLKPSEMLDGLGMAETTPGPLIMVLQFVGFMAAFRDPDALSPLVAATLGGLLATWVTFAPCFFWIFLGAPFVEKLRGNRALNGALSAITAAVVGVILNLAVWFAIHTIFREVVALRVAGLAFDAPIPASVDPWALGLTLTAAIAIFGFGAGMIPTLVGCSLGGMALFELGVIA